MLRTTPIVRASALMLALLAQGAHAGLTVTSTAQTATASASAQHSSSVLTPGPSCCIQTQIIGPVDRRSDASPVGSTGALTQTAKAQARFDGIVSESQSQGNITPIDDGITIRSSGSAKQVFPAAVDLGYPNPAGGASEDIPLAADLASRNYAFSASSAVQQTIGFRLSEDTQVQLDWDFSDNATRDTFAEAHRVNTFWQTVLVLDAGGQQVGGSDHARGTSNSSVLSLAAGYYTLRVIAFNGVSQLKTGESTVSWQAFASIRAVPEASTWAMMGLGLAAMGLVARRRGLAAQA